MCVAINYERQMILCLMINSKEQLKASEQQHQQLRDVLNKDLQIISQSDSQWLIVFNSFKIYSIRHSTSKGEGNPSTLQIIDTYDN